MKERPILFNGEMVTAIMEGRKTQTRLMVKGVDPRSVHTSKDGRHLFRCGDSGIHFPACPHGSIGDRLWVRESFYRCARLSGDYCESTWTRRVGYCDSDKPDDGDRDKWFKKPSIHMPRWASRILLEITDIRVERLQDISEYDALAEGVRRSKRAVSPSRAVPCFYDYLRREPNYQSAGDSFSSLWESINGPDSWDANPLVWVIEFKVIS